MIKLKAAKIILILHFCALAMWLGGVLSCLPLVFGTQIDDVSSTIVTYIHMREIAWNVIGWGGIGSVFTGLVLVSLTHWQLIRDKWLLSKFILTIGLVLFGMFFNEFRILENIKLLESQPIHPDFLVYHSSLKKGLIASATGFVLVIGIAVFKPWLKQNRA